MRYLLGLVRLAVGRSLAAPGLTATRFSGVLVAVTLVAGVSLYSSAMGDAMLQANLRNDQGSSNVVTSDSAQLLTPAAYAALDRYVRGQEARDLGLPLADLYVHHSTATLATYRYGARGGRLPAPFSYLPLDYYAGFGAHVTVVAGSLDLRPGAPRGAVAVAVSRYTAQSLRLKVGDRLAFSSDGRRRLGPLMVVTAIYAPRDAASAFWGINAGILTYRSLVTPRLSDFLAFTMRSPLFSPEYLWLYHTDLSAIHLADGPALLDRIRRVGSNVAALAPGATLITSLDLGIAGFISQYDLLPVILLILVAPIVALVLYTVAVTTALALDRQAGEIVLLRSRGATVAQVFALYVVEGLALGIIALLIGPPLGLLLARLIGNASGFLRFTAGLPYDLRLTGQAYLLSGGTAILSLLAGLIPALSLTRRSMTAFRQEQTRLMQRPLWQRLFLDVVALALALYGLFVLVRQGPISSGAATAAIAQDPVIGLAPVLFALALALFISRALPWLAALGARLVGGVSSPSIQVALQSVARAPRQPIRLVQLCALTLTLGVFAATVAGVEARNRIDQQLYAAGAQVRLMEYNALIKRWDTMPLADHLRLPGVHGATPALRFESSGDAANTTSNGTVVNVLGIDPATAQGVMWYRPDFAAMSFGRLLDVIARPGPAAIVSDTFLDATGLHPGDGFDVTLANGHTLHGRIAVVAHYFATLDPHQAPFVITNLAYLQRASASPGPSEVWLATDQSQATVDRIIALARNWPRRIVDTKGLIPAFSPQDEPLTAGIYGVVSVGFLIALGLALLGFVSYAYLSLQRRRGEFAIVRALGLSPGQLRWLLLCEQFLLLGAGMLGGIAAGILTTDLFLPYMPIAAETLPPFLIVMPWVAIVEFVAAVLVVFMLALSAHVYMLLRLQLGRVLRLGDV